MSPLLCLAHAASVTSHIRLATGLLIAPYYHPVPLAREIQTLHHLSNGRFVLGVGPGWDQKEFETLGMKLGERGRRTGASIAAPRLRYGRPHLTPLVDTGDREKALMLQRPHIERVMGTHRSFENLQESYFLGTTREIVERIADLERAGIQDMVLATCGDDLEQL